jgi:hypothetical protein
MNRLAWAGVLLLLVLGAAAGCGSEPEDQPLAQAEVFTWGDQPISFSPPPDGWRREKHQSGGLQGVRFVKTGSVGERIHVAEHYSLGDRDRCTELQGLLREFDQLNRQTFPRAVQKARLWVPEPINHRDTWVVHEANQALDRALAAYRMGDSVGARRAIGDALEKAGQMQYTLDEVVERVMFSTEGFDGRAKFVIGEPAPGEVAGEPMIWVGYTMRFRKQNYIGREVYVLKNNRLFVASFQGLAENLPLFERVVDTISFPPGSCEHPPS